MKKLLYIFADDYIPTEKEALICTAIICFVSMLIAAILCQCVILPVTEEKHIKTLNNLEEQLSEAESEYETASINIMIKMENKDWLKQQEVDKCVSIIFLAFGVGILTIILLYVLWIKCLERCRIKS